MRWNHSEMGLQLSLTLVAVLQLSACGEFSYKRGASVDALQQEKHICARTEQTADDIHHCLQQKGWIVVDMDKSPTISADASPANKAVIRGSYTKSTADQFMTGNAPTQIDQTKPLSDDPLQKVAVNSWWKAGASADSLLSDGKLCRQTLTAEHQINSNYSQVTVGFISCMASRGWMVWLK